MGDALEMRGGAGSAHLASLEGAVDSPSECRRRVLACKEESPSDIATKGVRDGVLRSTCHDRKIRGSSGVGRRKAQPTAAAMGAAAMGWSTHRLRCTCTRPSHLDWRAKSSERSEALPSGP